MEPAGIGRGMDAESGSPPRHGETRYTGDGRAARRDLVANTAIHASGHANTTHQRPRNPLVHQPTREGPPLCTARLAQLVAAPLDSGTPRTSEEEQTNALARRIGMFRQGRGERDAGGRAGSGIEVPFARQTRPVPSSPRPDAARSIFKESHSPPTTIPSRVSTGSVFVRLRTHNNKA